MFRAITIPQFCITLWNAPAMFTAVISPSLSRNTVCKPLRVSIFFKLHNFFFGVPVCQWFL